MNVLHINKFHYLRGGAEAVYLGTADILERAGHRSVYFSMQHPENLPCETGDYFMQYVDLNGSDISFAGKVKIAGRILYSLEAKKRLSKLLDRYPVDIAHIHNMYHYISPSILHELKRKKIPIVMTLHDYKMVCASYLMIVNGKPCDECLGGKYYNAIRRKCLKDSFAKSTLAAMEMYLHHKVLSIYDNVDIFISPSMFLKSKLEDMGFKKEIIYLPNYVDTNKFEKYALLDVGENDEENYIVYFGRLTKEKGLETLINAVNSTKVKLKIIGDGPNQSFLEEIARNKGINNICFLGYKMGDGLYKEIRKSRFIVLPSIWYENNPISVIEAFALGKPVIGARIGGIPELVKDGETGLTFEPGNIEDLRGKILALYDKRDSIAEMGNNARKFVAENLSRDKYYQKLMDIYHLVINKSHA